MGKLRTKNYEPRTKSPAGILLGRRRIGGKAGGRWRALGIGERGPAVLVYRGYNYREAFTVDYALGEYFERNAGTETSTHSIGLRPEFDVYQS